MDSATLPGNDILNAGDFVLDASTAHVSQFEEPIGTFRPEYFGILECLAQRSGRVVSYNTLAQAIRRRAPGMSNTQQAVQQYVSVLRQAVEPVGSPPKYIINQRGKGYLLVAQPLLTPDEKQSILKRHRESKEVTLFEPLSNQLVKAGFPFNFSLSPNTFKGENLTLSVAQDDGSPLPQWLCFSPETNNFYGTPTRGDVGTLSLVVTAKSPEGEEATAKFQVIVVAEVNNAPRVINALHNSTATPNIFFKYQFSDNTFVDSDAGDRLSYSASLENGEPLPDWLNFDPETRTFMGTPTSQDAGKPLLIKVVAQDLSDASVSDIFGLNVNAIEPNISANVSVSDEQEKPWWRKSEVIVASILIPLLCAFLPMLPDLFAKEQPSNTSADVPTATGNAARSPAVPSNVAKP